MSKVSVLAAKTGPSQRLFSHLDTCRSNLLTLCPALLVFQSDTHVSHNKLWRIETWSMAAVHPPTDSIIQLRSAICPKHRLMNFTGILFVSVQSVFCVYRQMCRIQLMHNAGRNTYRLRYDSRDAPTFWLTVSSHPPYLLQNKPW